eukprot:CAMPEP_0171874344 /NCGR_PEP_ID=MMETSP0992-20121227/34914_1 /TAXON_ID=483369 /ORGANISM="non described non described, Strain CCMP2098" /LENGTH=145 /DNA_ID=CAMNT_0012499123 /DNA_START=256 /DNA_END=693 /DNA_ORIENTATION=+
MASLAKVTSFLASRAEPREGVGRRSPPEVEEALAPCFLVAEGGPGPSTLAEAAVPCRFQGVNLARDRTHEEACAHVAHSAEVLPSEVLPSEGRPSDHPSEGRPSEGRTHVEAPPCPLGASPSVDRRIHRNRHEGREDPPCEAHPS